MIRSVEDLWYTQFLSQCQAKPAKTRRVLLTPPPTSSETTVFAPWVCHIAMILMADFALVLSIDQLGFWFCLEARYQQRSDG